MKTKDWQRAGFVERNGKMERIDAVRSFWNEADMQILRTAYSDPSGLDLSSLAEKLRRSEAAVACKASELGLCSQRGKHIWTQAQK